LVAAQAVQEALAPHSGIVWLVLKAEPLPGDLADRPLLIVGWFPRDRVVGYEFEYQHRRSK
jgi:hypothetical protein